MSITIHTPSSHKLKDSYVAHALDSMQRQGIALEVIGKQKSVTKMANTLGVIRKFVYQHKDIALHEITEAISASSSEDSTIHFYLPVTKKWIKQFVLSLELICHYSYQGVIELLRGLFDYDISKGNVHNIVYKTLAKAQINC